MEVKVKAVDSFCHGNLNAHIGVEYMIQKATADQLAKAGHVEILPATDTAPQTGVTDSQDTDDLLGDGTKAEAAPQNKMEAAPENKAAAQKPKK